MPVSWTELRLAGASQFTRWMAASRSNNNVRSPSSRTMLRADYTPSFPLRLMHKDLSLALDLGNQIGVPLPAAAAAREIYNSVKGASKDDLDYAAVYKFWPR